MKRGILSPVVQGLVIGAGVGLTVLAWTLATGRLTLPPPGFLYDDGIYLNAAQALASGQGYTLSAAQGAPVLAKYPPLFPALMASLLGLVQAFAPQGTNLAGWLQGLNLAVSVGALALCGAWFRADRRGSLLMTTLLVAILACNERWLQVSASLMSEPLYLALSMGALILAGRLAGQLAGRESAPASQRAGLLAGLALLCVAAFYTRSVGGLLILAMALWLGTRLGWRTALVWASGCGLACLPWLLHASAHAAPIAAIGDFWVRTFQEPYAQTLAMDLRSEIALPDLYAQGLWVLLTQGANSLLPVGLWPVITTLASLGLLGALLACAWPLLGTPTRRMTWGSPAGWYVGLSLLSLPLSNYTEHYPRLLLMIAPLILAMILAIIPAIRGQQDRASLPAGRGPTGPTWGLVLAASLMIAHGWRLAHHVPAAPVPWAAQQAMIAALREDRSTGRGTDRDMDPAPVLWTDNLYDAYLYALHAPPLRVLDAFVQLPADRLPKGPLSRQTLNALFVRKADALYHLLCQRRVNYVILNQSGVVTTEGLHYTRVPKRDPTGSLLLSRYPSAFMHLASSPDGASRLYRVRLRPQ